MPYNLVDDSFHTQKLCRRLSSSEVRFYTENGRTMIILWPAHTAHVHAGLRTCTSVHVYVVLCTSVYVLIEHVNL